MSLRCSCRHPPQVNLQYIKAFTYQWSAAVTFKGPELLSHIKLRPDKENLSRIIFGLQLLGVVLIAKHYEYLLRGSVGKELWGVVRAKIIDCTSEAPRTLLRIRFGVRVRATSVFFLPGYAVLTLTFFLIQCLGVGVPSFQQSNLLPLACTLQVVIIDSNLILLPLACLPGVTVCSALGSVAGLVPRYLSTMSDSAEEAPPLGIKEVSGRGQNKPPEPQAGEFAAAEVHEASMSVAGTTRAVG